MGVGHGTAGVQVTRVVNHSLCTRSFKDALIMYPQAAGLLAAEFGPRAVDALLDSDWAALLRDPRGGAAAAAALDVYGRWAGGRRAGLGALGGGPCLPYTCFWCRASMSQGSVGRRYAHRFAFSLVGAAGIVFVVEYLRCFLCSLVLPCRQGGGAGGPDGDGGPLAA